MRYAVVLPGVALLLALLLGGCGVRENLAAARAGGDGPAAVLSRFAVADLTAAKALATEAGDTVGAGCWAALIPLVQRYSAPKDGPEVSGAFSAVQRVRNLTRARSAGVPDTINVACAPVILDAEGTIARLGLMAAPGGGLLGSFSNIIGR